MRWARLSSRTCLAFFSHLIFFLVSNSMCSWYHKDRILVELSTDSSKWLLNEITLPHWYKVIKWQYEWHIHSRKMMNGISEEAPWHLKGILRWGTCCSLFHGRKGWSLGWKRQRLKTAVTESVQDGDRSQSILVASAFSAQWILEGRVFHNYQINLRDNH